MTSISVMPAQAGAFALGQIVAELFECASTDQALGFVRSVGTRIASGHKLGGQALDCADLAAGMNAVWTNFGWGTVTLSLDASGILIHHDRPLMALPGDDAGLWRKAMPTLLEGAYECWLSAVGGGDALSTKIMQVTETAVELHHGL